MGNSDRKTAAIRKLLDEADCPSAPCSAWRDPSTDPPMMTGRILVWIAGIGPHLVNVSEMSFHFWDGQDDTEMTAPDEWDWWTEISPPNAIGDATAVTDSENKQ